MRCPSTGRDNSITGINDDRGARTLAPDHPLLEQALLPHFSSMSPQNIVPVTGLADVSGSGLLIGSFR